MIRTAACVACLALLAACQVLVPHGTTSSAGMASPEASTSSPMESLGACRAAPAWLVDRLLAGLTPPGSGVTRIFVGRAANVQGSHEVLSAPWWVAALINGVGVRPAPAAWLVERLDASGSPRIWAADVNAHRYSNATWTGGELRGDGLAAVRACVGPIPEP